MTTPSPWVRCTPDGLLNFVGDGHRSAGQAVPILTWKPWERSTGPRTAEGMQAVSWNAWRGGNRQMLRELSRMVNEEVRQARELVERTTTGAG